MDEHKHCPYDHEHPQPMTESEENAYVMGERQVWRNLLALALRELGYDAPAEADKVRWVKEREDTIAQLRQLCCEVGDNEWDEKHYLADVVEKHLARHILER